MIDLSIKEIVNLPTFTGTLDPSVFIVGAVSNSATVKIPASAFQNTQLIFQQTPPSTPADQGTSNAVSCDSSGFYSYYAGLWGKTPRVTSNWDDFTENSRFLLVSSLQPLSTEEIQTARYNLGIEYASSEQEGLVRIATSMDDNTGAVPSAAVIKKYIDDAISKIVPAGSGGNVDLGNYSGPVDIKSSVQTNNGVVDATILKFNSLDNSLTVGQDVERIILQPNTKILIKDKDSQIRSEFDTSI